MSVKTVDENYEEEHVIKPSNNEKSKDTLGWPLLLKNYDKMQVRSDHFTPLTFGSSPLKRALNEYIKFYFFGISIDWFF
jgi:H/ACA ribonucleoprotein complex subunit 4